MSCTTLSHRHVVALCTCVEFIGRIAVSLDEFMRIKNTFILIFQTCSFLLGNYFLNGIDLNIIYIGHILYI